MPTRTRRRARQRSWRQLLLTEGVIPNLALRASLVFFTLDALLHASDERFSGKQLGPRNVLILFGFSLLFPAFQWLRGHWRTYPWWFDSLYLSIFWLDMSGNSLNLYNTVSWWDKLPHFWGPGALAMTLLGAFGFTALGAVGLATIVHVWLEIEEWLGDVFLHTHNVNGVGDTETDLLAGLAGAILFGLLYTRLPWFKPKRARREKTR